MDLIINSCISLSGYYHADSGEENNLKYSVKSIEGQKTASENQLN